MNRIALATRKGILILTRSNEGWTVGHIGFPGSHASMVFLDESTGNLFASLDDGHFGNKLYRWNQFAACEEWQTSDAKSVWQELAAPAYPDGTMIRDDQPAVLKYQWAWAKGHGPTSKRLYLGTEPGGLFYSDDDGDSFTFVDSLWSHPSRDDPDTPWMGGGRDEAAIHSICVDPRDNNRIAVGISVAGVYRTDDGMDSWQVKNKGLRADFLPDPNSELGHDPHLLVQCKNQPEILWQQNHCGVFVSRDGGDTWNDASQSEGPVNFGFAVAVDPDDGNTAWVVPAESDMNRVACEHRFCVSRTEDGGKTWTHFREGLPQEHCYDFAFRHALVLEGDTLVCGTACGSLYLSEDRGESWQTISNHFPPIYCIIPCSTK